MIRCGLLLLALASCNRWVRPAPKAESIRTPEEQHIFAVKVEVACSPFGTSSVKKQVGSGVMVSDWQVLTALHVIDCPTIPTIHVISDKGRWRFSPEKEWRGADIARIQMASGDDLGRNVRPPTLRLQRLPMEEPVYLQAGYPDHEEIIGESTGYSYGGAGYGGALQGSFSYYVKTRPGNSGSGVYDRFGQLVGIHTMRDGDKGYSSYVLESMLSR